MKLLNLIFIVSWIFCNEGDIGVLNDGEEVYRRVRMQLSNPRNYPILNLGKYQLGYIGKDSEFLKPFPPNDQELQKLISPSEFFESRLGGQMLGDQLEKFIKKNSPNLGLLKEEIEYEIEYELDKTKKIETETTLSEAINEIKEIREKGAEASTEELIEMEALIIGINEFITEKALEEKNRSQKGPFIEFLEKAGIKFGHALGFYISNIKNVILNTYKNQNLSKKKKMERNVEKMIRNVVLVGGVIEHLGVIKKNGKIEKLRDSQGNDLLLERIKEGVRESLSLEGFNNQIIDEIIDGIRRTKGVHDKAFAKSRDFYAFPPNDKNKASIVLKAHGTTFAVGVVYYKDGERFIANRISEEPWRKRLAGIPKGNKDQQREKLIELMDELLQDGHKKASELSKEVEQIYISWAGPGKYREGFVTAPNIWGFEGKVVNLKKELSKKLKGPLKGIKIEIQHDGIAAAKGEANQGGLEDTKNVLAVIWGTGIGAGLLLDNEPYYNDSILNKLGIPLGEIGHHIVFIGD